MQMVGRCDELHENAADSDIGVGVYDLANAASADTLTGCLKPNGKLVKLAVGDTPASTV